MPAPRPASPGTTSGHPRPAGGHGALRRRAGRRVAQPRPQLRGRRRRLRPHRAFPPLLPALRRARLRHRLPDRCLLQAHRGRHRAGQCRAVHRLRPVRLGLPLRRARARPGRARHAQMHAVHRPHLQHRTARGRSGSRPASWPARPGPGISAISAIRGPRSRGWWPSAAASALMPELGYRPVNRYLPPREPVDLIA